ncbi:translocation/assembly module TamB domain-containing protein [Peteryoungia algae]|uniref:Translocation/assembly module TamB domain-containing protein n=1 Tax=Peteryoungia algae TaxID=2919917 RepID=A0ABT0D3P4_9HYPH|nr:translocation/assembly module TamB domain-containing protein [Rhizobium sp. SSM4.3]MCJ8240011.1 translocation/assembly module TamB domain-containing protein [Rhizobium sp. SSM4.3]
MIWLKRILTWTLRLLGGLVAVSIALFVVVILVGGFSRTGSQFLADRIAALVSTDNRQITLSGTGPLLSSEFFVERITVSDAQGVYASIEDLALDWTPRDLIRKRFTAERISARQVTVSRPPLQSTEPEPETDEPFSLPVEIDIATINLPSINIGAALAERDFALSAQGSLQIVGDTIGSRLTATRLDEPGNNAVIDLLYAPNDNQLRVNLDYQEPAAGLLGQQLQLPGQPPLAIEIDGDGPLDNWAGEVTASLDGERTITIDATHQLEANGTRTVTAAGGGFFSRLMPPALRDIFAGETAIDVAAALGADGSVVIEKGRFETASAEVVAAGRYDPNGDNDIRLMARATGEPVSITAESAEFTGGLKLRSLDLALSGEAPATALSLHADLAELTVPQGTLSNVMLDADSESFDIANREGPVNISMSVQGTDIRDAEIRPYIRGPLALTAPLTLSSEAITFDELAFDSDGLDLQGSGRYALDTNGFSGRLAVQAAPDLLPPALADRLQGPVDLSARVDFVAPRAVALREIVLSTDIAQAEGSLSIDQDGILATDLTGQLRDIGLFVERIRAPASFNLSASGPLDAVEATVNLAVEQGEAAGYRIEDLALQLEGVANRVAPSGNLTVTGQIDGKPLEAKARVVSTDGQTKVDALDLAIGPNRLTGALDLGQDLLPSGDVSFDFPDISLLAALAGQNVGGDLKGEVAIRSQKGQIAADIEATGTTITQGDLVIAEPRIDLTVTDMAALAAKGTISADGVASGANRLDSLALEFTRSGSDTDFDLSGRYDNAPVVLRGALSQGGEELLVAVEELRAAPRGIALALASPTSIRIVDGAVSIAETVITAGSGRLALSGTIGDTLDLSVDIRALPASLAAALAPEIAPEGTISGTVEVGGVPSAPVADYRLDWQGAAIAQTRGAGLVPFGITANGRFENQSLTLDSRINGGGIGLTAGGNVSLQNGPGLDIRIQGDVPLSAANGQLGAQGFVAEGNATVNLTIGGTGSAPSITGTVSTSGARVIDVRRNLAIEQIATTVNLTGTRAEIGSLTGNLAAGGRVSARGFIDITAPGLPADLTIDLDQAVYVDGTTVASTADGQLTLTGQLLNGPRLAGSINLSRTSITLSESQPASLRELDIVHLHAPPAILRQQGEQNPAEGRSSSAPIVLDLTISSPTQTFVRGRGIDAELGGTIRLTGTAAAPAVSGAFDLRRGRMQILTKRLDITRATITFGGDLVPLLDLEATTTSGDATIVILLTGLASNPQVSFSSTPSLPQDEILAQLIFGQSLSRLSPLQIAQLADAAAQLAGGSGSSLFQSLRSTLGVDDLDISTDETGGTSISAGKYLNDRTYIELEQSGSGGAKAVINLDIGRGVKLKGEAGGAGAGGGIFYENEY